MSLHRGGLALLFACIVAGAFAPKANPQGFPPAESGARMLPLARRIVSGERAENSGRFEVVGRKNGSFLISIRLVPSLGVPQP